MKLPTITDSRGKKSVTLFLIFVPYVIVLWKFLFSGLVLQHFVPGADGYQVVWTVPPMSGAEFLAAISPLLTAWHLRESGEKKVNPISGVPL